MAPLSPQKNINKCRKKNHHHWFKHVPKELVTEILARVASLSVTDLINAKTSCKEFFEAASEDYVFEHVNISSFPVIPWWINHGASSFLERCKKSGNPEALFRQGILDYFSTLKHDSGLQFLKKAASKEHVEATYVYGIILVCYGGKHKNKGVKLLSDLKRSNSSFIITQCRKKVQKIVEIMWVKNYIVGIGQTEEEEKFLKKRKPCNCCNTKALCSLAGDQRRNYSRWTSDEDFEDDHFSCDSCLWDLEAMKFCKMLRTGSYR